MKIRPKRAGKKVGAKSSSILLAVVGGGGGDSLCVEPRDGQFCRRDCSVLAVAGGAKQESE